LAQVLENLMSNALRHTPERGEITLSGAAEGDTVYLRVKDTGDGISPEDLPYIFDRFYRADKSRQRQGGESGLGLAIAKSFVEVHGGSLSVESTLGEGTIFTIALPKA
jgi:two-component system sensor histidine kinase BaeS